MFVLSLIACIPTKPSKIKIICKYKTKPKSREWLHMDIFGHDVVEKLNPNLKPRLMWVQSPELYIIFCTLILTYILKKLTCSVLCRLPMYTIYGLRIHRFT